MMSTACGLYINPQSKPLGLDPESEADICIW